MSQSSVNSVLPICHDDPSRAVLTLPTPRTIRSYPNVRTALSGSPVTQTPKRIIQIRPVYITRQFHSARTSSRTKWRRIKPGRFIVPSK